MRILFLSNEYPPHIYGGAGVHVGCLSRELIHLEDGQNDLQVLCFGEQKEIGPNKAVIGIPSVPNLPFQDPRHEKLVDALYRNAAMVGTAERADIVHCHTWYTHLAGCLLKQLLAVPLVLTVHSLEPHRPWKEEQLGNGYKATTWLEKMALANADGIIAVSQSMRNDVHNLYGIPLEKITVIHNGIDLAQYKPTFNRAILSSYGIDPDKPFLLFVGRITRQKGIIHLVNAVPFLDSDIQVVLCAGAPDTEAIAREMQEKVEAAGAKTANEIIWISEIVPRNDLIALYSHASLFVCPSIYEPFGIINLEAMACNTPVVAASVGGIREVVNHDRTGLLVPFESVSADNLEPKNPEQYSRDLATAINTLFHAPEKLRTMAVECRRRVEEYFSWESIAQQTLNYYRELLRAN